MRKSIWLAAVLAVWITPSAKADLFVDFGQSSYVVAPGASIDIEVFLRQTSPTTILADEGLFSAGLRVNFNLAPFNADPAQVTAVAANTAFNTVNAPPPTFATATSAGFADLEVFDFSATGAVFPSVDRILLGTFTFQAGLTGTTLLNVVDLNPGVGFDDFVTGQGVVLDDLLNFGSTTIRVSAVPEPNTCVLLMFGGMCMRLRRGRRRLR